MVTETLVMFPREAGRKILDRLDAENMEIIAAFWLYGEEEKEWRLVIVTPLVDTQGPLATYAKIRTILYSMAMEEREGMLLSDITLMSPMNSRIDWMRRKYGIVTEEQSRPVWRMRPAQDEPYIYRLT